jgi:hypothetical protein
MPKQNKTKGKKEKDEDFDDMLAELQASDLASASNAANSSTTSSSSSGAEADARPSVTLLPGPTPEKAQDGMFLSRPSSALA